MRTRVTATGEPTVDVRFCLVFPRETISVPVVRRVLGDTLNKLGVDEESVADLLLAVTEACTNVLRHSGPGRRYEVVATVGRNRCVLDVVDTGRGFDPATLQATPPPPRPPLPFRPRPPATSSFPSLREGAGDCPDWGYPVSRVTRRPGCCPRRPAGRRLGGSALAR